MKYRKIALSVMAAAIVLTGCVKNPSEKGVEYLERSDRTVPGCNRFGGEYRGCLQRNRDCKMGAGRL